MVYPSARKDLSVSENHFGVTIPDPYRWLEDPDSEETVRFVTDQNDLTKTYLSKSQIRDVFEAKMTKMMDYPRFGCPIKSGQNFYYFQNSGLQAQSVLYKLETLDSEPKLFLDPNSFSSDGTVSISSFSFSESGKYFAYALSESGSDWVKIHVRETRDGASLNLEPEPIKWAKFTGIEWSKDESGFFYNRYPPPKIDSNKAGTETESNTDATIYYHKLNTLQENDIPIFSIPEHPTHMPSAKVSDDGDYLIISISESCDPKNKLYIGNLSSRALLAPPEFVKIIDTFESHYSYVANDANIFYFETTLMAPKKRIVKFDLKSPELGFVEVIAESADVIDFASPIDKDKIAIVHLKDVKHVISVYSLPSGNLLQKLPLPSGCIVSNMTGHRKDSDLFYSYSSFGFPSKIARYDFKTGAESVFRESQVSGLKSEEFVVKQVFYPSKDGLKIDSNNPTLLYGYGGFNISILPSFSVSWAIFVQHMNGIIAVANIRGGGEFGEDWYNQGRLVNKQNVFDDFQWAAKWLITERYTNPSKLAINGGSNGGLLVGACVTQNPSLIGCAIADVGVLDMLRFHKFTIGHAWTSDYGNPDVEEDFKILLKYSPLHNVTSQEYPAILICTGDHDDRVVPLHSLKFLATLQATSTGSSHSKPILGRIETKAGHGAGKSTMQRINETADKFAFIGLVLDVPWIN